MCETYVYDLLPSPYNYITINTIRLHAADHIHVLKFSSPIKLTTSTKLQKNKKKDIIITEILLKVAL